MPGDRALAQPPVLTGVVTVALICELLRQTGECPWVY